MKSTSFNLFRRPLHAILATACLLGFGTASANADNPIPTVADQWRVEVSPYVWAPGIKGTMGFDNGLARSALGGSCCLSSCRTSWTGSLYLYC